MASPSQFISGAWDLGCSWGVEVGMCDFTLPIFAAFFSPDPSILGLFTTATTQADLSNGAFPLGLITGSTWRKQNGTTYVSTVFLYSKSIWISLTKQSQICWYLGNNRCLQCVCDIKFMWRRFGRHRRERHGKIQSGNKLVTAKMDNF